MKKKLKFSELGVQSFVTSLDHENTILGMGEVQGQTNAACAQNTLLDTCYIDCSLGCTLNPYCESIGPTFCIIIAPASEIIANCTADIGNCPRTSLSCQNQDNSFSGMCS